MNYVDDAVDIAVSVIMTVIMLSVGTWCIRSLNAMYSTPLYEKTAPLVVTSGEIPRYELTGVDALLSMVVADENTPVLKVRYEANTHHALDDSSWDPLKVFDADWFESKNSNINSAWKKFFKNHYRDPKSEWVPEFNSSTGKLKGWRITLIK